MKWSVRHILPCHSCLNEKKKKETAFSSTFSKKSCAVIGCGQGSPDTLTFHSSTLEKSPADYKSMAPLHQWILCLSFWGSASSTCFISSLLTFRIKLLPMHVATLRRHFITRQMKQGNIKSKMLIKKLSRRQSIEVNLVVRSSLTWRTRWFPKSAAVTSHIHLGEPKNEEPFPCLIQSRQITFLLPVGPVCSSSGLSVGARADTRHIKPCGEPHCATLPN